MKSLKRSIVLLLMASCPTLYAQQLSGRVLDRYTLQSIPHATIITQKQTTFTSEKGIFTVYGLRRGDTIKITFVGYKPHFLIYSQKVTDTIPIYLDQTATSLKSVVIIGKRPSNTDSVKLRKEFAPVFAYKGTAFKDVFMPNSSYIKPYNDFITSTHSTATLLSVNLLQVIDWLGKNKTTTSKLQQTLLKDEQNNYVEQVFSRPKVVELTRLKGDSLQNFMDKYRPSSAVAHRMNDYEMMIYIKKCYGEFVKQE
ncbi:carboxypeptidase-like regulatory domain-containing protein [Mucilaginibacter sp. BT774]|uniref:carboxypeptidase-like regulatory domain-containing protein n=1 Tax=Mucilaginibacter sp. BT774 TaxID=3062276 RepID=UPI0026757EB1|nr:carboxypeptidase-like regulatory domain-containing protein [Mucilaginibacter sp. BT774]MDO3625578.1 carboxypeptidase-like regulatory domain-containing protein [Mucilaginibacter sp. BT774]